MRSFLIALILTSSHLFAANIAVIDSGLDYKHEDLKNNIWTNPNTPVQTKDADGKVYKDNLYGWNFAENNNQVIDYKYLGTFSSDCTKIFDVQAKILQGTASSEEQAWYKAKKSDQTFLKELQKFGNFVHGTHVGGISAQEAEEAKLVALKLIPTETPGMQAEEFLKEFQARFGKSDSTDNAMVKMFLKMMAGRQATLLITTGKFTAAVGAEIANGSFGTSVNAVKPILKGLLQQFLGHEPSEAEQTEYAIFFVQEIATASKDFVGSAKETLFVFAAGNDGTDNDTLPTSPANIKAANSITVAATNGLQALASFSNFGNKMVEVAAPGVAVLSTIPGDAKLQMSGTSMAAPFVTNVAGLIKDNNRVLTPADIKQILMGTVDQKDFLKGKVTSGGIVNLKRSVRAAQLSKGMSVQAAISLAKEQVQDEVDALDSKAINEKDLIVLPLPSLF